MNSGAGAANGSDANNRQLSLTAGCPFRAAKMWPRWSAATTWSPSDHAFACGSSADTEFLKPLSPCQAKRCSQASRDVSARVKRHGGGIAGDRDRRVGRGLLDEAFGDEDPIERERIADAGETHLAMIADEAGLDRGLDGLAVVAHHHRNLAARRRGRRQQV